MKKKQQLYRNRYNKKEDHSNHNQYGQHDADCEENHCQQNDDNNFGQRYFYENQDQVERQLERFFYNNQANSTININRLQYLPYAGTLFSPYLKLTQPSIKQKQSSTLSSQSQKQSSLAQPPTATTHNNINSLQTIKSNLRFIYNVMRYLYPYFSSSDSSSSSATNNDRALSGKNSNVSKRKFIIFDHKDQKKKIVKIGWFMERVLMMFEEEMNSQGNNKSNNQTHDSAMKQFVKILSSLSQNQKASQTNHQVLTSPSLSSFTSRYHIGAQNLTNNNTQTPSNIIPSSNATLLINRLFSLPDKWLNYRWKLQQKQQNHPNSRIDNTFDCNRNKLEEGESSKQVDQLQDGNRTKIDRIRWLSEKYQLYRKAVPVVVMENLFAKLFVDSENEVLGEEQFYYEDEQQQQEIEERRFQQQKVNQSQQKTIEKQGLAAIEKMNNQGNNNNNQTRFSKKKLPFDQSLTIYCLNKILTHYSNNHQTIKNTSYLALSSSPGQLPLSSQTPLLTSQNIFSLIFFPNNFSILAISKNNQSNLSQHNKIIRRQKQQFLISNINHLTKQNKLIQILYYTWIQMCEGAVNAEQKKVQQKLNGNNRSQISEYLLLENQRKKIKKQQYFQLLIELFAQNISMKKELYNVIESGSEIGQELLKVGHYKMFYELLDGIDKRMQTTKAQTMQKQNQSNANQSQQQSFTSYTLSRLSLWWSYNKDFLLPIKSLHFRYNLLALLIQKSNIEFLQNYKNGLILATVSQGIQKRLVDVRYYKGAILVWAKFNKVVGFQEEGSKEVERKGRYFVDQQERKQQSQQRGDKNNNENKPKTPKQLQQSLSHQTITSISQKQQINQQSRSPSYYLLQQQQLIDQQQYQSINNDKSQPKNNLELISQFNKNGKCSLFNSQQYKKHGQEQHSTQFQQQLSQQQSVYEIKLKPPQTLYDCVLALENATRRQIGFVQLNKILSRNQRDVIFVWKILLRVLMHPLEDACVEPLKRLFILRTKEWIQDVAEMFFKKDIGMNEKIIFIKVIEESVIEMSQNPKNYNRKIQQIKQQEQEKQFYFKRVASKYYVQKKDLIVQTKENQRTRRWGHTKIAYEKNNPTKNMSTSLSNKPNLFIVNNDPYVNRLYQVICELFFKIISKMCFQIDKSISKQPLIVQNLLVLLGTISPNIKNHYQKYTILQDVASICLNAITEIETILNKQVQSKGTSSQKGQQKSSLPFSFSFSSKKQKPALDKKSLTPILMACIQTLNKLSLSIDKYLPSLMLESLKMCIITLKKIDMYSIRPLVDMVEANIFRNMSLGKDGI